VTARPLGRLAVRDLLDEALAGVAARPARLALTAMGTVLGIAALVATLGLAQTAAGQVAGRFDALDATRVVVAPPEFDSGSPAAAGAEAPVMLPWDAEERVARLNGVVAAGTYTRLDVDDPVRSVPVVDPTGASAFVLPVTAASPGLVAALSGHVVVGRQFDAGHDQRADPIALLGANAAARLDINRIDHQPTIFIGDVALTVIGIVDDVSRRIDLLDAVIVPNGTAARLFGLTAPAEVQIQTALGAAQVIGRQAPIALAPNQPGALRAQVPPSPGSVRAAVEADVNALFLVLGGVALLVGALGIANVTLLSVLERVGEIGLRRALGATRRHVASQFLLESLTIGLLGGLIGTAGGIMFTVGVSVVREWTALLDLRLAAGAPLLGAVIGLAAGTYPAWKASAVEPIAALRSS
jgi:putative ABC transport system permease protein